MEDQTQRPSRFWRTLIIVNVIVTLVLALWVVLFATGTDSLLPPALDPNVEVREEIAEVRQETDDLSDRVNSAESPSIFDDVQSEGIGSESSGQGLETWGTGD